MKRLWIPALALVLAAGCDARLPGLAPTASRACQLDGQVEGQWMFAVLPDRAYFTHPDWEAQGVEQAALGSFWEEWVAGGWRVVKDSGSNLSYRCDRDWIARGIRFSPEADSVRVSVAASTFALPFPPRFSASPEERAKNDLGEHSFEGVAVPR